MKLLTIVFLSTAAIAQSTPPVHVQSTTTKAGEYRPEHIRTAPNHTTADNYSTKGNTNPYTGKSGTKNPK